MSVTKFVDDYIIQEALYPVTDAPSTSTGNFNILGRLVGPHFVPDGTSRNQRYYSRQLWENVLKDDKTKLRLERRLMFGTIGHAENFDVETFAREGLLSHVTVKMWIDENTGLGMAENWILDTPAGRSLYAMCKGAGSRFYTSSRASGSFKEAKYNGVPVVDEGSYDLLGWDLVVDPGFLQADPSLMESLKSNGFSLDNRKTITLTEKTNGGSNMSTELIEKLTKEKIAMEGALREALSILDTYKKIGTPERIKEALKAYLALGTPKEIGKAFDVSESAIKALQVSVKKYEGLGSVPDLEKALKISEDMLSAYSDLGTPEEVTEALNCATSILKEYKVLGTPKEIDEALDKASQLAVASKKQKNESAAKRLSKAYKTPLKVVESLIEKLNSIKEVESILKGIREEDESGYRLGIEWPGNDADDTLMKHYSDEGETILGDTVGPDGGIDLDKDDMEDEDERDLDVEMSSKGRKGALLNPDEDDDEDESPEYMQPKKVKESKKLSRPGFNTKSIFEQLISKK